MIAPSASLVNLTHLFAEYVFSRAFRWPPSKQSITRSRVPSWLWLQQKQLFEEELEELWALQANPAHRDRADLAREIAKTEKVLHVIELALASGSIPEELPRLESVDSAKAS